MGLISRKSCVVKYINKKISATGINKKPTDNLFGFVENKKTSNVVPVIPTFNKCVRFILVID